MFSVVDNVIYYQGRAFAVLTVDPVSNGGWVIDAREEVENIGFVDVDQLTEFRTAMRSEINDTLNECLTNAVEKLWLPEVFDDVLRELIGPTLHKSLDSQILQAFHVDYEGKPSE